MQNRVRRRSLADLHPHVARPVVVAALAALLLLAVRFTGLPYGQLDWTVFSQAYETPTPITTTLSLAAVADTTLDEAAPAENQGDGAAVWVGQVAAPQSAARRGLFRFDLGQMPAGAHIKQATLELYLASAAGRLETEIAVFGVLDAWDERQVTWETAPAVAPRLTSAVVGVERRYYTWDVTELVREWYAGSLANNGLLLRDTDESTATLRGFFSREARIHPPRLVVAYAGAPPLSPTPTLSATPTATPTIRPTATPSPVPSPTATLGPGECNPDDPASACSATLTVHAYVDHRCDGYFVSGLDWPIAGARVNVTLADGTQRSATTNAFGFATFVQVPVPAGYSVTVSIRYPQEGPGGTPVVPCSGSPETVTLTAGDLAFGQFRYVPFRAQPATFGIP
ncbi:MAG: DNRLRE domain-containing protein [Chloroflexi bacterium]|nr:MAG: DNRLRE domain-containing protein [Chloroflexota bacterium]